MAEAADLSRRSASVAELTDGTGLLDQHRWPKPRTRLVDRRP
ncbi:hypothetical protein [Streptomyces sp. GESEQ-35]|nr:hypothetical protein [Streptomyces sp. GESEQ-35]